MGGTALDPRKEEASQGSKSASNIGCAAKIAIFLILLSMARMNCYDHLSIYPAWMRAVCSCLFAG